MSLGLANRLFTSIETATRGLCEDIAAGAPLTITHAKRAVDLIAGRPGHVSEADIATLAATCFASADYLEGRTAFAQKRQPIFRGV